MKQLCQHVIALQAALVKLLGGEQGNQLSKIKGQTIQEFTFSIYSQQKNKDCGFDLFFFNHLKLRLQAACIGSSKFTDNLQCKQNTLISHIYLSNSNNNSF